MEDLKILSKWEVYKLAKGDRPNVDKKRIDYGFEYLYGNRRDHLLDRHSKKRILEATIWHDN